MDEEKIIGTIERVFYSNPQNHWAAVVLRVEDGDSFGLDRMVKASGIIPDAQVGVRLYARGVWKNDPKYGMGFEISSLDDVGMPVTYDGVLQYLSSGYIRGLGPKTAKALIKHFSPDTVFDIIENHPERLSEVKGISKVKAEKIAKSYAESCVYRTLLTQLKLTDAKAKMLYQHYGNDAVKVIKEDPYRIIYDCDGIGFKLADRLALENGFDPLDPKRVKAAITFCLLKIGDDGHCWTHIDNMSELLHDIIPDLNDDLIATCLAEAINSGEIIMDAPYPGVDVLYAKKVYEAEDGVANLVMQMLKDGPLVKFKQSEIDTALDCTEASVGFDLSPKQKQAISSALRNRVSIITGGAGTGKTTIIQAIIDAWIAKVNAPDPEQSVRLCAPTGKAARRMSEVTDIHAETIQRMLCRSTYEKKMSFDEPTLIVVDEASMIDIMLAYRFLSSLKGESVQIVFVGDIDQLPPIGAGNFFRDLVQSPLVPTVKLDISHRQHGYIAINADRINKGQGMHTLVLDDPSFEFRHAERENAVEAVLSAYKELLDQGYKESDICVVVPIRKSGRSRTAADDLNKIIRDMVNPPLAIDSPGLPWRIGDRIMYTMNDYQLKIFNGDCGTITGIDYEDKIVELTLDDGQVVQCNEVDQKFFIFAYVMTVHKAQGSQFKTSIVVANKEHSFMLQRNLLYTAVTRAKEKIILIGEGAAVNIAVKKIPAMERNTSLLMRLVKYR